MKRRDEAVRTVSGRYRSVPICTIWRLTEDGYHVIAPGQLLVRTLYKLIRDDAARTVRRSATGGNRQAQPRRSAERPPSAAALPWCQLGVARSSA